MILNRPSATAERLISAEGVNLTTFDLYYRQLPQNTLDLRKRKAFEHRCPEALFKPAVGNPAIMAFRL
jgi:hypothetical protein